MKIKIVDLETGKTPAEEPKRILAGANKIGLHERNNVNSAKAGMNTWASIGHSSISHYPLIYVIAQFFDRPNYVPFFQWLKFCFYELKDAAALRQGRAHFVPRHLWLDFSEGDWVFLTEDELTKEKKESLKEFIFDRKENAYIPYESKVFDILSISSLIGAYSGT